MSSEKSQAGKRVRTGPISFPPKPGRAESPECLTLSIEEAARILEISRCGAYNYAKDGRLPTIRIGSRLLVPKAAIEKLLAECMPA
jgi:excisionase family DNA binding protein